MVDNPIETNSPGSGTRIDPGIVRCLPDQTRPTSRLLEHKLTSDELLHLYQRMVEIRRFDELAMSLQRQGQLGVWASCLGQEAAQIGSAYALADQDWVFPSYRETAVGLMRGITPGDLLHQYRGTWLGGYDPYKHRFAMNSIPIATHALHATGLAMAAKRAGDNLVSVAYIGDGATSEGDAHEAMNFAAVFAAPVVFFVQNNHWAISVPLSAQTASPTLADRAPALGFRGMMVDGNDVAAVHRVMSDALEHARGGHGPVLVEAITYRIESHTTADDHTRYRTAAEVEEWRERDPIARLEHHLDSLGMLTDDIRRSTREAADAKASAARIEILQLSAGDPTELFQHVYHGERPLLQEQREMLRAELRAWEEM